MPLFQSTRNSDGTYGPTKRGDYYISKPDHRRTARYKEGKTRWCIKEGEEFSVFSVANENYFFCNEAQALFSIIDDCQEVLGQNGQRVAKFPDIQNANDPWHGYPVTTKEKQNRPSSELLDKLQDEDLISLPSRLKIEKGFI
jgi:hypothetical protein